MGAEGGTRYLSTYQMSKSANLRKNIDYHIFGLIDDLELEHVQNGFFTLRKIEAKAAADTSGPERLSRIHVHGILVNQGAPAQHLYEAIVTNEKDLPITAAVHVSRLVDVQKRPQWLQAVRLGGSMPLMIGRVKLNLSTATTDRDIMPPATFAARRVENMSRKPDGTKETGWIFHDNRTTVDLVKRIDVLLRDFEQRSDSDRQPT